MLKSLKKVLKNLGEVIDRLIDALVGRRQPESQLIPVPVRDPLRR